MTVHDRTRLISWLFIKGSKPGEYPLGIAAPACSLLHVTPCYIEMQSDAKERREPLWIIKSLSNNCGNNILAKSMRHEKFINYLKKKVKKLLMITWHCARLMTHALILRYWQNRLKRVAMWKKEHMIFPTKNYTPNTMNTVTIAMHRKFLSVNYYQAILATGC